MTYSVLLLDPKVENTLELATHLAAAGFPTRVEASPFTALQVLREEYFVAVIVVADLENADCLARLVEIRRRAVHTWMIVVSPRCDDRSRDLIFRHGGDACITAPVSAADLVTRLQAFRLRSRPSF